MSGPPKLTARPFPIIAFGWLWIAASLAQLALAIFLISVSGFTGPSGAQLFLTTILLLGGAAVALRAVIPLESGLFMGVIFALGFQGLRLFNGLQDGAVEAGVVLNLAFDVVQGLALMLLRIPAARAWMEANWAVVQAFYAKPSDQG